jgi:hypothetical protein
MPPSPPLPLNVSDAAFAAAVESLAHQLAAEWYRGCYPECGEKSALDFASVRWVCFADRATGILIHRNSGPPPWSCRRAPSRPYRPRRRDRRR